jgi:hypothetical protein
VYLAEATGACRLKGAKDATEPGTRSSRLCWKRKIRSWVGSKMCRSRWCVKSCSSKDVRWRVHVAAAMESIGAEVALPMVTPERFEGSCFLGAKRTGSMFTQEDIEILTILANQLAISMENARLYADLKRSRELIQRSDRCRPSARWLQASRTRSATLSSRFARSRSSCPSAWRRGVPRQVPRARPLGSRPHLRLDQRAARPSPVPRPRSSHASTSTTVSKASACCSRASAQPRRAVEEEV